MSLVLAALLLMADPSPTPPPPPACQEPERRQFDFWVGEWDVTDPKGVLVGGNVIEPILGGCALRESWTATRGFRGTSLNSWSPDDGLWHQTWVDQGGSVLLIEGGLRGRDMVMEGPGKGPKGEDIRNRITWTPRDADHVRQLWDTSSDGGKTWTVAFDGLYARKKR